jgi:hypothetical protein
MTDEDRHDELIANMFDEVKEVRVETVEGQWRVFWLVFRDTVKVMQVEALW